MFHVKQYARCAVHIGKTYVLELKVAENAYNLQRVYAPSLLELKTAFFVSARRFGALLVRQMRFCGATRLFLLSFLLPYWLLLDAFIALSGCCFFGFLPRNAPICTLFF